MSIDEYDLAIVGGGIVGCAVARSITAKFQASVVLLEQETRLATRQTGRNSGVIHSGIYYKPNSHKAKLCTAGRQRLYSFCDEHGIEYKRCGKIIVATNSNATQRLEQLFDHGTVNGLTNLELLNEKDFKRLEPNSSGVAALHVPQAGIVDFSKVANKLAELAANDGCNIIRGAKLLRVENHNERSLMLGTKKGNFKTRFLINCSGLQADRVAKKCGVECDVQIIPFRGEYFSVNHRQSGLVNGLIYPVPDPVLPFLGVHITKKLDGSIEIGPNALFATGRHSYKGFRLADFHDLVSSLSFPGFWKLSRRHWKTGISELHRSINTGAMLKEIQKLVPAVKRDQIKKSHSGIRAQAVSRKGELLNDFLIERRDNSIHVLNAPSPAATSSLAIGSYIATLAQEHFDLVVK